MINSSIIYFENAAYPNSQYCYSPSERYPEYQFQNYLSTENNDVYKMIRDNFIQLRLDELHINTKEWNPLGEYIKEGDTVLLKPNWVMHKNEGVIDDMDCMITHPSVVRAVVDYVLIALKGTGRIIVADAPMQGCDLSELFERTGYKKLFEFWKDNSIDIDVLDLRKYKSVMNCGIIEGRVFNNNRSICVELEESFHKTTSDTKYKVSDYLISDTEKYHNINKHSYEINRVLFEANVVINIPKPKCHRLAGLTGAMKNSVGVIYEKACLPHRTLGSKDEGGDAYRNKSIFKSVMQKCDEKQTEAGVSGKKHIAKIYNLLQKLFYVLGSISSRDRTRVGGWYGNDTIWRTVADINRIVMYGDISGNIQNEMQRKILCIGDMIVCGQKNGPVKPTPKKLGMILISENPYCFDNVLCRIMGFSRSSIKTVSNSEIEQMMGFSSANPIMGASVVFNGKISTIETLEIKDEWAFEPHDAWVGHI